MAEQGELTAELAAKRHERRHAGTVTFLKTTPNFLLLVAYSSHLSSIPAPVGLPIHPSGTVIKARSAYFLFNLFDFFFSQNNVFLL